MKTRRSINKNNKTKKNFKKKNCSPYGEKVKIDDELCLSGEVIQKIKKSYNMNNPTNKIKVKNTKKIVERLKEEKPQCESDVCWLSEIKDVNSRKTILKKFYAPKQPKDWRHNPDEWLSNWDILEVISQYEEKYKNFKFFGPTPINFDSKDMYNNKNCVWNELCNINMKELINNGKEKIGIIFNLAKQGEAGTHWVSLFININKKYILYFDSNGDDCPKEIEKLIKRIKGQLKDLNKNMKVIYNNLEHQKSNTECGMYSLYFIITLITEEINGNKIKTTDKLLSHFTKNRIPDELVFKYRDIYYNKNLTII